MNSNVVGAQMEPIATETAVTKPVVAEQGLESTMPAAHPVAASSLVLLALLGGQATAQEAREWLDRMNRAVEELNYRGTFVHVLAGTAETLYIIHRNQDGSIGERIVSVDGGARDHSSRRRGAVHPS